jgi:hypothetical protein
MKAESKGHSRKKIDIVCKNAKARGDQDRANVKRVLHIGIRPCGGQDFVLLKMACCPDTDAFSHDNQNDPDDHLDWMGSGKYDQ